MVLTVLFGYSQTLTELQIIRGSDTPNGSGNTDRFGREVAVSGSTAVISAPGHNNNSGALYVFELNSSNQWIQVAKLTTSDQAAGREFGHSLAFKDDVIVAGNFGADYSNQGAYIFEKPVSGWTDMTETIKLNTPASPNAANQSGFGTNVDINGPEILVGAPREDVGATVSAGRIYVYEKSGVSWSTAFLRAELTTTNVGSADYLGQSAVFGNDIIVSGAFTGSSAGTLHIFERPAGGTWANATTEDIILFGSDRSNNDEFGGLVLTKNDLILTIGGADISSSSEVNLYTFEKEGLTWSAQSTQNEQNLEGLPQYMPFPGFGATSIFDMSIQSNILVIGNGASTGPTLGNNSPVGSVLINDLVSGNTIHEIDGINYSSNGNLGTSVAIQGSKLLIGSQLETIGGAVRYYDLSFNETLNQTLCPGSTITLGSQTITTPGIYSELFTSVNGLDSLIELTVSSPLEPAVTSSSTTYGMVTISGLVITPDQEDNISTHFRISNILGGILYLSDGVTEISSGDYISLSQGAAGLIFDPDNSTDGAFDIQASVGTDGSCVSSNFTTAEIIVSKASLSVIANDQTITYGDALPTYDGTLTGVVSGDNITASYSSIADGTLAGSFDITATLNDPDTRLSNYQVTNTRGLLTISKASLTATADDITITEDDPLPALTYQYGGFVNGEDESVLDSEPTISTDAVAGNPGIYSITLTGGADNNYDLQLVNGTLSITDVLAAFETHGFKIYPNPTSDMLEIEGFSKIKTVRLIDMEGRILLNETSNTLEISDLKAGIYILEIESNDGKKTSHRVIKQ